MLYTHAILFVLYIYHARYFKTFACLVIKMGANRKKKSNLFTEILSTSGPCGSKAQFEQVASGNFEERMILICLVNGCMLFFYAFYYVSVFLLRRLFDC